MTASSLSPKSQFHDRSNNLPSRPYPLIQTCNEHLNCLRASAEASSMLRHKIGGLQDLIESVEKLIQLPLIQDALLHELDELLDGSLRLLDVCSAAKDALLHTKECTRELQSIIRRRKRGGELELITTEVKRFSSSRKVVQKAISKALANLKATSQNCNISSSTNRYHRTAAIITLLKDVEVVTLSTFQILLQYISGTPHSKSNSWLSISKLIQPKRVGCSSLVAYGSEFAQVDLALQCFMFSKTTKSEGIKNLQNQLEKMESCIQDLEEGLEFLFRRLIKIRVFLLNILNH
ncbi:hypothetical protein RJT34_08215 [Clitoria ternatea]|uniref:DUF241 domain protein n=1 Tax=Clitoria ternatea TaxID=43366 RepID=A0AAN9PSN3_CLITE